MMKWVDDMSLGNRFLLGVGVIGFFYWVGKKIQTGELSSDPKGSLLTPASTVPKLRNPPMTTQQNQMARLIVRQFRAAGLSDPMAIAAIVNSWAESTLNPNAVSPSGKAVGLFQLHEDGAGHGMSVSSRKDPITNTNRIIQEVKSRYGQSLLQRAEQGASIAELIKLFTVHIERPGNAIATGEQRASMAGTWFGPSIREEGFVRIPENWEP